MRGIAVESHRRREEGTEVGEGKTMGKEVSGKGGDRESVRLSGFPGRGAGVMEITNHNFMCKNISLFN